MYQTCEDKGRCTHERGFKNKNGGVYFMYGWDFLAAWAKRTAYSRKRVLFRSRERNYAYYAFRLYARDVCMYVWHTCAYYVIRCGWGLGGCLGKCCEIAHNAPVFCVRRSEKSRVSRAHKSL